MSTTAKAALGVPGSMTLMSVTKLFGKAAALVAALGVLANTCIDVYDKVANVPTTERDKTNDQLFKKHYHDLPKVSQNVEIQQREVSTEMLLEVYADGDILVNYGGRDPQWFPARSIALAGLPLSISLSLISTAHAQAQPAAARPSTPRNVASEAIVRPRVILDVARMRSQQASIDLNAQTPAEPSAKLDRAYLVAQTKDDHPSAFSTSTKSYVETFQAEPGHKIVDYRLQVGSQNSAKVKSVTLLEDGRAVQVTYDLSSGPVVDQWRGWIKGTLQTSQVRAE